MTLILNDEDVGQALKMSHCIKALEDAYRDLGQGMALSPGRKDCFLASKRPDAY